MDIKEIGHIFGQAREASGLTQARAAALAGLSRVTVSDFERGAVEDLGIAKVERLMRQFDAPFHRCDVIHAR